MPKKTREQKILADSRRNVSTFHYIPSIQPKSEQTIAIDTGELTAIKKDLTKTVVLAAIAIAAELILFWFEKMK